MSQRDIDRREVKAGRMMLAAYEAKYHAPQPDLRALLVKALAALRRHVVKRIDIPADGNDLAKSYLRCKECEHRWEIFENEKHADDCPLARTTAADIRAAIADNSTST